MSDDAWVWEYAFHTEDELGYPEQVRREVKALADQITELANLGIDPAELGSPTGGSARRHTLPSGGWFETQHLPRARPRLIAVVLVVPPQHLL